MYLRWQDMKLSRPRSGDNGEEEPMGSIFFGVLIIDI